MRRKVRTSEGDHMKATATTCACAWAIGTALWSSMGLAHAQSLPVTQLQRATAQQVAQQGVPLSALSDKAPDSYTVQPGDTLWRISGLFLRQPWLWPELWGMNLQAIANPHLIYPGQVLYLERSGGYARLSTSTPGSNADLETIKLSPRVRSEGLSDLALPTLQMHLIEAFLSEPLVLSANTLHSAPRIIGSSEERVLWGQGDRVYARGSQDTPLLRTRGQSTHYRVFRQAKPLRDPITREILGYEAQYLGQAVLERGEAAPEAQSGNTTYIPATLEITRTKEEMLAGDRLWPEPERQFHNFVPHAPQQPLQAHVVSLYGSNALRYGTQHQVVSINKGLEDGMAPGMVLSLISKGRKIVDKTGTRRANVQLPDEENGMGMVFRSFDRVSYVLIMDIQRGVQVGDQLVNPR